MKKPPREIDGARVLEWAWSGDKPFGQILTKSGVQATKIFGLAICRYSDSNKIYRFSCDSEWESEQDADYESVQEAKENLPSQYQNAKVVWQEY